MSRRRIDPTSVGPDPDFSDEARKVAEEQSAHDAVLDRLQAEGKRLVKPSMVDWFRRAARP